MNSPDRLKVLQPTLPLMYLHFTEIRKDLSILENNTRWAEDINPLITLLNIIKFLNNNDEDPDNFLPWLMFADALDLRTAKREDSINPRPRNNSALFLAM